MATDQFTYQTLISLGGGTATHRAEVQDSWAKTACGRMVGSFSTHHLEAVTCKKCLAASVPPFDPTPAPEPTPTTPEPTMTAKNVNPVSTTGAAVLAYADLTPAARDFMALVGHRRFDFFDDGIVEHSGNWSPHLSWQAAAILGRSKLSVAGVMAKLAASPCWLVSEPQAYGDGNSKQKEPWWSLTAIGAEVALLAAQVDTSLAGE